ncbi:protein of unknown function [Burkholderia multivorans]
MGAVRQFFFLGIALGHLSCCEAGEVPGPILSVSAEAPALSLDVFAPGKDGILRTPRPLDGAKPGVDADGVSVQIAPDGKSYYNVGTVSVQLSGLSTSDIDSSEHVTRKPLSPKQRAALGWLRSHQLRLPNGAITWQNTQPLPFDDLYIKTPWSSAYSQAAIIKALIVLYRQTGDRRFLTLATKAAYAYGVPCEDGGLQCRVGKIRWYEEVPAPHGFAPLILNGHLFSVLMLYRLHDITYDPRVLELAKDGAQTASAMIVRYDTGYWSIYQQRQRADKLVFNLAPSGETYLRAATLAFDRGPGQSINFAPKESFGPNIGGTGWAGLERDGVRLKASNAIMVMNTGPLQKLADFSDTPDSKLVLKYKSVRCAAPLVGISDAREGVSGYAQIRAVQQSATNDGFCSATYRILPSQQTWTTLTPFYHEWHTRLVWELAKRTGDPTMTATAFRWKEYSLTYDSAKKDGLGAAALRPSVFDGTENRKIDAMAADAVRNLNALEATPQQILTAFSAWAKARNIDPGTSQQILRRLGLPQAG